MNLIFIGGIQFQLFEISNSKIAHQFQNWIDTNAMAHVWCMASCKVGMIIPIPNLSIPFFLNKKFQLKNWNCLSNPIPELTPCLLWETLVQSYKHLFRFAMLELSYLASALITTNTCMNLIQTHNLEIWSALL